MMIVSAYTPNLKDKKLPECHLIEHEPEEIETFSEGWPDNRPFYCTAQGGEFMNFIDHEGIICLIDADTTIQRQPTEAEFSEFLPPRGQFTACLHSYPAIKLDESKNWLLPTQNIDVNPKYLEISAAMLIAHSDDWKRLREIYVNRFQEMKTKMRHHAMTQWLISWIIQKHFGLKLGPEWLHNAIWYRGTRAKLIDGELFCQNKKVIFNHTKWIDANM
jgi:hypothetical protein